MPFPSHSRHQPPPSHPPCLHDTQGINACRAILEGQDQLASIYVNNNGLSAAAAQVQRMELILAPVWPSVS